MKKINKIILSILVIFTLLFSYSCDPFDELFLTLSMDLEFNVVGGGTSFFKEDSLCLSDFDDYNENRNNIEEIKYIASIYITLFSPDSLSAQNLTLTLYKSDRNTSLFRYEIPNFISTKYINNPLEISLSQSEINNINNYLLKPTEDKCFYATISASNVVADSSIYRLNSKVEFLTQLKIKP